MMSKLCIIYANCQGTALGHFLNKNPVFQSEYQVEYLVNYLMIDEKKEVPFDLLQKADLFIYQPTDEKHGVYATDNLLLYLKDTCHVISFPYIYNNSFWPFFKIDQKIVNAEPIIDLLESGASAIEIVLKFFSLRIDFNFQNRFQKTMQLLLEKEAATTVKVSDYILENYKKERLFLTHNHPSTQLLVHCVNQILSILQYPTLKKGDFPNPNEACLPGFYPMSAYDKAYYKFSYADDWRYFYQNKYQGNWKRRYLQWITEICLSRHEDKNLKYHYEKAVLKMFRSLAKYLSNNGVSL